MLARSLRLLTSPPRLGDARRRDPARTPIRTGRPGPAAHRFAHRDLVAQAHAQLLGRVIPEDDAFLPLTPQQLTRHPPRPPIGVNAPPPSRILGVVRAHPDTVTLTNRDGIRVLRRVLAQHAHYAQRPTGQLP